MNRLVATFGNGQHGRLGHDSSALFPRVLAALAGESAAAVSAGGAHTAVVTDAGGLWTFGLNNHGQTGHASPPGSKQPFVAEPREVILPDAIAAASAGESHTLALSNSGEVWAAGSNGDGQLGLGPKHGVSNPEFRLVQALKGERIVAVAAGGQHSLALSQDGRVYAWGHGHYGALGLGQHHLRWEAFPLPVQALAGVRVRSITAGAFHSGAIDEDGQAWVWGHGGSWQLGMGLNAHECLPQQLRALRNLEQLCLGFSHSMSIGKHGEVAAWGTDENGSLGQGFRWPRLTSKVPEPVKGVRLRSGAAGWKHSAGVSQDGRLYTWGWGGAVGGGGFTGDYDLGAGQLGHGDDMDQHEPKQVQRLLYGRGRYRDLRMSVGDSAWHALAVSCGRNHTAAIVEAPGLREQDLA